MTLPCPDTRDTITPAGGPELPVGAVADGEFLKRVGDAVVGASGGGSPTGSAGGDLAGTYPNPSVAKITESGGPTSLTIGAIADGQPVKRSGATLVGYTPAADVTPVVLVTPGLAVTAAGTTALVSNDCVAVYLGVASKANPTVDLLVEVTTAYVGAGGTPYTKACIATGAFFPGGGATLTTRGTTDASAIYNGVGIGLKATVSTSGIAAGDEMWAVLGTKTAVVGPGGVVAQFRGANADTARTGLVQFKAAQDPAALSGTGMSVGGATFVPPFVVGYQY